VAPYSFLGADHPLADRLAAFRAAIAGGSFPADGEVHADLTLRPGANGTLELHRAYWSVQADRSDGFRATTLSYRAGRDRATWFSFPADPDLPALAEVAAPPARVLRYMPQRRCALRTGDAIAKVKRPHRAAEAWTLLAAVHRALGDGRAGFAVAAPLAHDSGRATYTQTLLPGADLAALVDTERGPALLRRAGALHRAMHAATVPGVPAEDPAAGREELRADAAWVAFARPGAADEIAAVMDVLERRAPAPAAPAFCHGDLVPSQLLLDGDAWAITDFDGARAGDPHRDLATWLAALTSDVPALRLAAEGGDEAAVERAAAAYLDGYGDHDPDRLRWHRAAAEVHHLAVMLKKDRHHPARFARGLRVARACAEELDRA
jgi:aminoglycoside phosphotransferase